MSTQEHATRSSLHYRNCVPKPLLVAVGAAEWRKAMRMQLAEGEVTPKDSQTGFAQRSCQCDEKRRLAVLCGTVRENEDIARRTCWDVKETGNARGSEVKKKTGVCEIDLSELTNVSVFPSPSNGGESRRAPSADCVIQMRWVQRFSLKYSLSLFYSGVWAVSTVEVPGVLACRRTILWNHPKRGSGIDEAQG